MTINPLSASPLTRSGLFTNLEQPGGVGTTTATSNPLKNSSATNPMLSAVVQALSQVGISVPSSATAATGATTATQGSTAAASSTASSASQALQNFLNNLYASLNAQSAGSPSQSDATANGSSSTPSTRGGHHHHGHGHMGSALQNLIDQLNGSTASGTVASGSTATGTGATSASGLASLQQSFTTLAQASGSSGSSQPQLGAFLNALKTDLPGRSSAGALVSALA
jgi:hypothetical protein